MKAILKQALQRRGYDLRRIDETPDLHGFLVSRQIDTVVDVGANAGQFGKHLRARGYSGRIVSFEPLPSVFRELERTAAGDPRWTVVNAALGDVEGEAALNLSAMSEFSSFRRLNEAAERYDPKAAVVDTQVVTVRRLDSVWDDLAGGHVFLKIDTQGFERPVLSGAQRALREIKGVQLELPVIRLYEESWSLADAIEYMLEAGFVLAQVTPTNFHSLDPMAIVEIDGVFRRRDPRLD